MSGENNIKEKIRSSLVAMLKRNQRLSEALWRESSVFNYSSLVRKSESGVSLWTDALQRAIDENEVVIIPEGIYYIDKTLVIPSNRRIMAHGAHIKKIPEMNTLLLRNEHLRDGSFYRIDGS
ncbi:MAG: hypothetical protein IKV16_06320, partial [Clostridia bacterium]|nr:hypothetical protein [Clostridia bacterium]